MFRPFSDSESEEVTVVKEEGSEAVGEEVVRNHRKVKRACRPSRIVPSTSSNSKRIRKVPGVSSRAKSSKKRSRRRRRDRPVVEEEIEPQYTRSQKTKFADILRALRYATSEDQLRWGQSAEQLAIKDSRIVSLCEDILEQVDKRTRGY